MSSRPRPPPEIRGMFGPKGDSLNWLDAVSRFPNGVPRFDSKDEALQFMIDYNTHNGGSNPDYPHLQHIFTMLVGWEQIESILLPNIEKARKEQTFARKISRSYATAHRRDDADASSNVNIYESTEARVVVEEIAQRLNVPFPHEMWHLRHDKKRSIANLRSLCQ
jgi:hypothetical protein